MTKCLLFTEKLFVFKYCVIFIVLGLDTSTHCSMKMLILIRFVAIFFYVRVNKTDFIMAERENEFYFINDTCHVQIT